ncbi:MAG: hypothetical protein ACTSPB_01245 [Candidatus Thorarchaeota archaeon]
MSELDEALNYVPLNDEGTDVVCRHGSRWIYWIQESKWVDVVRRSDCECPDPPRPEIIKQVAVDADNIEKYAPFWVRSIFSNMKELFDKYEVLVGEVGELQHTEPIEEEDKTGDWFYDPDDLAKYIKDEQKYIDNLIQLLVRETSIQSCDLPVKPRRLI